MWSLDEVQKIVGLSRRQIQKYENEHKIAIKPKEENKTERGFLRYTSEEIERLWLIKFYTELDYTSEQMKKRFNDPAFSQKTLLDEQIDGLKKKIEHYQHLLNVATYMSESEEDGALLSLYAESGMTYAQGVELLSVGLRSGRCLCENYEYSELSDEDCESWCVAVSRIMQLKSLGFDHEFYMVQDQVEVLFELETKGYVRSVKLFRSLIDNYASDGIFGEVIEKVHGEGSARFLYDALDQFCTDHEHDYFEKDVEKVLDVVECLKVKKHPPESEQVQREIERMYRLYDEIKASDEVRIELLRGVGETYGTYRFEGSDAEENSYLKELFEYYSDAIRIFCDNYLRSKGEK